MVENIELQCIALAQRQIAKATKKDRANNVEHYNQFRIFEDHSNDNEDSINNTKQVNNKIEIYQAKFLKAKNISACDMNKVTVKEIDLLIEQCEK